jgi:hypothetical protein
VTSNVLTCAFCGHAYPPGTPASQHELLTRHVMQCSSHPLRQGGIGEIAVERAKQRLKWGDPHDDEHGDAKLVQVAADLLMHVFKGTLPADVRDLIPDPDDEWRLAAKHADARDRLRIAGALVAAELDRLNRLAKRANAGGAS